jgi:hypothetical protein
MSDTPKEPGDIEWLQMTPKDPDRRPRTNILELTGPALLVHPQRERILELIEAGRFQLRRTLPSPDTDPETFTLADAMVQAYVIEDDGEIISICTFPVTMLGSYVDVDIPDTPEGLE